MTTTLAPAPPTCEHPSFHIHTSVDTGRRPMQAIVTIRCSICGQPFNWWHNNSQQAALVTDIFPVQR